ncbi:arsenate reductase ArsC [Paenibacillus cymbidii]|uniref:arsenate reductase ArsC n=1 Tax=Paenibacillus cymbidii TaxID=1639034 RepID=UPI00143682BE|nr:arsenate reductase ArsC [Paenibacillus cymbidii]
MAEAFANEIGGAAVIAESAGLEPQPIHPLTIAAMKEVGIDLLQKQHKKLYMKTFISAHIIIKLCDDMNEKCPVVPFGTRSEQWNIPDPLPADGSEADMDEVRKTRDMIERKVRELLRSLELST